MGEAAAPYTAAALTTINAEATCPCGTGQTFASCCQPLLRGERHAPTAEALMRARYSAYATGDIDFITATQDSDESVDREATEAWSRESTWHSLEVLEVTGGGPGDKTGTVEFIARYSHGGEELQHHEEASFEKRAGRWTLVDGRMKGTTFRREEPKLRPNEPCPCGSGKKYKKCCGKP
jgi:SEC-C motif-containing protein